MNKKKVGIITMHRVLNHGSALQAFALQEYVRKLGYDAELIDYVYPNLYHMKKVTIKRKILTFLMNTLFGLRKKKRLFSMFYKGCFNLSEKCYLTQQELHEDRLDYDIYMTGSDQVWNAKSMKGDSNFLLGFAPSSAKKISFASSFGIGKLPSKLENHYAKYLAEYESISVREANGKNLIDELIHKEVPVVCDPAFLLDAADYTSLIGKSTIKQKKGYILAYVMSYAYDPYPTFEDLVNAVREKYDMPVVYITLPKWKKYNPFKNKYQTKIGPCEFIDLFQNASFVITSLFHGTAFSLIFRKPFYAILPEKGADDRIESLLAKVGAADRGVRVNGALPVIDEADYEGINTKMEAFVDESREFLMGALLE